jgi:hypothetical protein
MVIQAYRSMYTYMLSILGVCALLYVCISLYTYNPHIRVLYDRSLSHACVSRLASMVPSASFNDILSLISDSSYYRSVYYVDSISLIRRSLFQQDMIIKASKPCAFFNDNHIILLNGSVVSRSFYVPDALQECPRIVSPYTPEAFAHKYSSDCIQFIKSIRPLLHDITHITWNSPYHIIIHYKNFCIVVCHNTRFMSYIDNAHMLYKKKGYTHMDMRFDNQIVCSRLGG